ncbi:hypothetical protein FRC14_000358 [Serendipita sp. 396]|nr:hypothetical protein FRC14_000358 [Serendipita sp. 396]
MAATPFLTRAVQFDDISISSMGSPAAPTSIDYINGQLVAHGFTHGQGLNLSDMRGQDQQMVVKCLSSMLGQRLDDMRRAEQLGGKYKTLAYDQERLLEQHRAAKEAAAQAEREMETGKARVEAAQKKLHSEEEGHKKTKEDFQKLKMAVQYLRTTTSNDIKRKEKEIEKMTDRWSKISNDQVKLGTIGAGIVCANLLPEQMAQESKNDFWEAALAESEQARLRLMKENDAFRDVIVGCVNALVTVHHSTVEAITKVEMDEPELILSDALFLSDPALTQAETAQNKLRELFGDLREVLSKAGSLGDSRQQSLKQREEDAHQIRILQQANVDLQNQLNEAQLAIQAQGQQLLDQFVSDARFMAGQRQLADLSMDLIETPDKKTIGLQLEEQRKHLEEERDKFTEAVLNFGREKAALEAQRLQFLEEKRVEMVQSILDDLPPTPEPSDKPYFPHSRPKALVEEQKSKALGKSHSATLRVSNGGEIATKVTSIPKVEPVQSSVLIQNSTSEPQTTTTPLLLELERMELPVSTTPPITEDELSPTSPTDEPSQASKRASKPPSNSLHSRLQKTPVRRTNAHVRMQHKYSPVVPSPLSRMRTVDSPPSSPESKAQQETQRPPVIVEEDEEEEGAAIVEEIKTIAEEVEPKAPDERRGSLSPLSRIMNMGLSPAIAPTLAVSSFPGLLGTGSISQNLLSKPRQTAKGFGAIPSTFSLGTAIQPRPPTENTGLQKTVKATTITKPRLPPQPKKVLGENKPRVSKESTSSSSSSGSTTDGRSSSASSKKNATIAVRSKKDVPSTRSDKENEKKGQVKATAMKRAPIKAIAPTRPLPRAPVPPRKVPVSGKAVAKG